MQDNKMAGVLQPENFYKIEKNGDEITIGARVTLSDFRSFMKIHLPEMAW
jgi:hypothetical protein